MSIKVWFIIKSFGFIVGLTIYNFLYENFINGFILDSIYNVKQHFQNVTLTLPDSN